MLFDTLTIHFYGPTKTEALEDCASVFERLNLIPQVPKIPPRDGESFFCKLHFIGDPEFVETNLVELFGDAVTPPQRVPGKVGKLFEVKKANGASCRPG